LNKKTVTDIEVSGKRVLVRVDFNVPLDIESGTITDDTRIRAALPTINYLRENQAKIILCSHLGRPKGKVVKELRLDPVVKRLSGYLGQEVKTASDCVGDEIAKMAGELKEGEVLLLENIRFHPEEEQNDPSFARSLARLADIFVNDAFGTAHRSHASTVGVANYLPAVAGFLMQKEFEVMGKALENPESPFALLLGGAKVSDKIGLVKNTLDRIDALLVGGAMAATFLRAYGYAISASSTEDDELTSAQEVIEVVKKNKLHLLLPIDVMVAEEIAETAKTKIVPVAEIPSGWHIVDIGPETVEAFSEELKRSRTIIWVGPMGIYEIPECARGTQAMAQLLSQLKATTIIGGGSTAEAVESLGLTDKMTHVSTGGGASLRFLEGKPLPGIAVLQDK
jgi:phosphoglycerate kinase